MPLPPVVIELPPRDVAAEQARVLVRACSTALVDGECRLADGDASGARAIAIVSWNADHSHAHIEIGMKSGASRWSERDLRFQPADPETERWKSVGLVIGALVGEAERRTEPQPRAEPRPVTAPPRRPEPGSQPEPEPGPEPATTGLPRGFVEVAALAGPALDDGTWRFGGGLAAGIRPLSAAPLWATIGARYQVRREDSHEVAMDWTGLSVGGGVLQPATPSLSLELTGHAVLERVAASVSGAPPDAQGRWVPGLRLRGGLGYWLSPQMAGLFGAEATGLASGTRVTLEGQPLARAPALSWGLWAAVRIGVF